MKHVQQVEEHETNNGNPRRNKKQKIGPATVFDSAVASPSTRIEGEDAFAGLRGVLGNEDSAAWLELKREQNRRNAALARRRQKSQLQDLQNSVSELSQSITQLKTVNQDLNIQLSDLVTEQAVLTAQLEEEKKLVCLRSMKGPAAVSCLTQVVNQSKPQEKVSAVAAALPTPTNSVTPSYLPFLLGQNSTDLHSSGNNNHTGSCHSKNKALMQELLKDCLKLKRQNDVLQELLDFRSMAARMRSSAPLQHKKPTPPSKLALPMSPPLTTTTGGNVSTSLLHPGLFKQSPSSSLSTSSTHSVQLAPPLNNENGARTAHATLMDEFSFSRLNALLKQQSSSSSNNPSLSSLFTASKPPFLTFPSSSLPTSTPPTLAAPPPTGDSFDSSAGPMTPAFQPSHAVNAKMNKVLLGHLLQVQQQQFGYRSQEPSSVPRSIALQ